MPPKLSVSAAAAMALLTPISAWQPPIAAEMVAPFLNILPISDAVSKNLIIFSSLLPSQKIIKYCSTAGITPAAPFVGAVTTLPKDAFSSFTANAKQLTQSNI